MENTPAAPVTKGVVVLHPYDRGGVSLTGGPSVWNACMSELNELRRQFKAYSVQCSTAEAKMHQVDELVRRYDLLEQRLSVAQAHMQVQTDAINQLTKRVNDQQLTIQTQFIQIQAILNTVLLSVSKNLVELLRQNGQVTTPVPVQPDTVSSSSSLPVLPTDDTPSIHS